MGTYGWIAAACGTIPPIAALIYLWATEGLAWYFICPVIAILMVVFVAVFVKSQLAEVRTQGPAVQPTVMLVQRGGSATGRTSVTSFKSGGFDEEAHSAPTIVAAQVRVQGSQGRGSPWASGFGA
mmetsp:Transcript_57749/g.135043  ORF Transcript_57749/g.135043 Transcript_57749/m.135043 type:complete len:125 (+) Transcript_57749:113-487(+)